MIQLVALLFLLDVTGLMPPSPSTNVTLVNTNLHNYVINTNSSYRSNITITLKAQWPVYELQYTTSVTDSWKHYCQLTNWSGSLTQLIPTTNPVMLFRVRACNTNEY